MKRGKRRNGEVEKLNLHCAEENTAETEGRG